jgi:hypothetical protein
LSQEPTYRVRGKVLDPVNGDLSRRFAAIEFWERESILNAGPFLVTSYHAADGTFELNGVPTGAYFLRPRLPVPGPVPGGRLPQDLHTGITWLDVQGADIDDATLSFDAPISLNGSAQIDVELPSTTRAQALLILKPWPGKPGSAFPNKPIHLSGPFKTEGISIGEYQVDVIPPQLGPESNIYVKQLRFSSTDLFKNPMVISGPTPDALRIVFAKNGGRVTGVVSPDPQRPSNGAQVVLVPARRDRLEFYKYVVANRAGSFTFRGVPPGSYKVFAWSNIQNYSWFDSDVLRKYEKSGTTVEVREFQTVNLSAIKLITN